MTPQEHEILALKMKALAQKILTDWMADLWQASLAAYAPEFRRLMVDAEARRFQRASDDHASIALPWLDPATSDLQSALFQEAFQECSKELVRRLRDTDESSTRS